MTVPSSIRRAGPFPGTGVAEAHPFAFKVFAKTDVSAQLTVDGVTTTLVQDSDYTVSLNIDQEATPGGVVACNVPVGASLTLLGAMSYDQPTDLPSGGAYRAKVVEDALDRVVILTQQLAESADRSVRAPVGEILAALPSAAARANKTIAFDGNGDLTVTVPVSGSAADVLIDLADNSVSSPGALLVGFRSTATGAVARDSRAKMDDATSLKDFGAVGNGIADDTARIQVAVASGRSLNFSDGVYRITSPIEVTTEQNWYGDNAIIRMDHGSNAVRPLLVVRAAAAGSNFEGIIFDHNAASVPQPELANQIAFAWLCGVIVMADNCTFTECDVRNSWDNGFATGLFSISGNGTLASPYSGSVTPGKPERVLFDTCRAVNCGTGEHNAFGEQGKKGAGFNTLNGSRIQYTNCSVDSSYNGFISDFGNQAQASYVNCIANNILLDNTAPNNGSGIGYYMADGPNILSACKAYFCQRNGFVIENTSASFTGSDLFAYACFREGFVLAAGNCNLSNITADSCGSLAANTYDAVRINSSVGAVGSLSIFNLRTRGGLHRYGISAAGANTIDASLVVGRLNGATGLFNYNPAAGHQIAILGWALGRYGFGVADPAFEVEVAGETGSYITNAVGDSSGNGTFVVSDRPNRDNRLAMGYDSANNVGVIQSLTAGISARAMLLNPSGGDIGIGTGVWNTGCARLGAFRLWVDGSGRLRIKNGAPSSDTDGTVVGTQT